VGATTQTDQNWLRSTFIESLGACEYDALTTRVVIVEVSPLPAVLPNVSAAQAIVSVETNGSESQSDKFYIRGVGRGTEPRLAQASAVAAAAGELASRWAQK
jgi:hypothetical protein